MDIKQIMETKLFKENNFDFDELVNMGNDDKSFEDLYKSKNIQRKQIISKEIMQLNLDMK